MKKGVLLLFLCTVSLACGAQVFLDNPDYIYGIGVSTDEYSADSTAMLSLSRAIYTDVTNETFHSVEETSAGVNERFLKSVSLKTSIRVEGARKYTDVLPDGNYKTYYYFNKSEYISRKLSNYAKYLNDASVFEKSTEPHAVNFLLGALYRAYREVDDILLNVVCAESMSYKAYALNEIERVYEHNGYMLSVRPDFGRVWYMVRDENSRALPGFEYINDEGKWVSPIFFYDELRDICSEPEDSKWALINLSPDNPARKNYHLLYEMKTEHGPVKIDVPNDFYFEKYFVF